MLVRFKNLMNRQKNNNDKKTEKKCFKLKKFRHLDRMA